MAALASAPAPVAAAAASIRLSPASGGPGTHVTITGSIPQGSGHGSQFGNVCWDGCTSGLPESLSVQWTSPNRFRATFVVPPTAYLTTSGPHALSDGAYPVSINCVGNVAPGCDATDEATATFRLTGPTPAACKPGQRCAWLHLSPDSAKPGDLVRITGWAPLTEIIGTPFGYSLTLSKGSWTGTSEQAGQVTQTMSGAISGTFRIPPVAANIGLVRPGRYALSLQAMMLNGGPGHPSGQPNVRVTATPKGGATEVYLAPVALRIGAARTWNSLGAIHPSAVQTSMPLDVASREGEPRELAYCTPGAIQLSMNGGRTWAPISTLGAVQASKGSAYPLFANAQAPTCASVVIDPVRAHTFYATFGAYAQRYGSAPPVFEVVYMTRNGGRTWQPVPTPKGYGGGDYAGIQAGTNGVTVLFQASPSGPSPRTGAYVARTTVDGGAVWKTAALTCGGGAAACVRFGPAPGEMPGMGAAAVQPLLRSTDHGRTWTTIAWPQGNVIAQGSSGQSELATVGRDLLFVDANSAYPVRLTTDGGRTWQDIALPALPHTSKNTLAEGIDPYTDLMMLADGSLLASNGAYPTPTWYRLAAAKSRWQKVPGLHAIPTDGRLLIADGRLWWVPQPTAAQNGTQTAQSAPLP